MPDRWMETVTDTIVLRHDGRDARDAERLIGDLTELAQAAAARLSTPTAQAPEPTVVVLHGTMRTLLAAHPGLAAAVTLTSRANRRLVVGAAAGDIAHVLSPRALRDHAVGGGPQEREYLRLAPHAALAQALVAGRSPLLRRPTTIVSRRSWILWGAGQHLSGQTDHTHGLIRRHLRRAERASYPPRRRDAVLLGGSVFDLIARDRGQQAVLDLLREPTKTKINQTLGDGKDGHTAGPWRSYLARLAESAER